MLKLLLFIIEKQGLIKSHRLNPKGKKLFIKEEVLKLFNKEKK
jgi:hypothetical protein